MFSQQITKHKEREALKGLSMYELKVTASRRIKHYWSLERCMDSLDIIEEELDGFKGIDMTVEQMLVGRLIFEVIKHKDGDDASWD